MRLLGWLRSRRHHPCPHYTQGWRDGMLLVCLACGQLIAYRLAPLG